MAPLSISAPLCTSTPTAQLLLETSKPKSKSSVCWQHQPCNGLHVDSRGQLAPRYSLLGGPRPPAPSSSAAHSAAPAADSTLRPQPTTCARCLLGSSFDGGVGAAWNERRVQYPPAGAVARHAGLFGWRIAATDANVSTPVACVIGGARLAQKWCSSRQSVRRLNEGFGSAAGPLGNDTAPLTRNRAPPPVHAVEAFKV